MEKVIYQMVDGNLPDVLGVCELESKKALEDLIKTGKMKNKYSFSHFDSKDERGIDVALIYNKEKFSLIENRSLTVKLSKDSFEFMVAIVPFFNSNILRNVATRTLKNSSKFDEKIPKNFNLSNNGTLVSVAS